MHWQPAGQPHAKTSQDGHRRFTKRGPSSESIVSLMMFLSIVTFLRVLVLSIRLMVYLMGAVRGSSLVSSTKTASSFAGSVLLALRLIEWIAPGGSDQLSPAR
jgi:hypothetical protein